MFRFTIRDLLWLMVVVALSIGWWMEYRKFTPSEKDSMKELRTILKDHAPIPVMPVEPASNT